MNGMNSASLLMDGFIKEIAVQLDEKDRLIDCLQAEIRDMGIVLNGMQTITQDKPKFVFEPDVMQTFGPLDDTKPSNPKDAVGVMKAPLSNVPAVVMAEVGVGLLEGKCKYGGFNFRAVGVRASVYYDATIRHLFSWWEGEDIDPDSQLSHVTKAICSLVVLRDAMIRGMMTDDRPPSSLDFYKRLNKLASEVIEKHKDKNPRHYTIADDNTVSDKP
jgi:hypothetical protein